MKEKPIKLSRKHQDALRPFAAQMVAVVRMVADLTEAETDTLIEACEHVTPGNCSHLAYEAAHVVHREAIFHKRMYVYKGSRGRKP